MFNISIMSNNITIEDCLHPNKKGHLWINHHGYGELIINSFQNNNSPFSTVYPIEDEPPYILKSVYSVNLINRLGINVRNSNVGELAWVPYT